MRVAEVFGYDVADQSDEAWQAREARHCRFRDSPCTKSSITEPLGVCSLSDGDSAASLCPVRFLERKRIFVDAAAIAFGPGTIFGVFPEIRILEIPAILLAAGYGLWLGSVFYRSLKHGEPFKEPFLWAIKKYYKVILPLLLLAAFIEAFLTSYLLKHVR